MSEELKDNNNSGNPTEQPEKEINLLELLYKLWDNRKVILVWCMWGVLAGLIIAFSIPKEFSTSVTLAPEINDNNPSIGGLGALASMAGISTSANSGSDAVYPTLYPDIVESVPFNTSLFNVPVTDEDGNTFTVREYIENETKGPWWGFVFKIPGKLIGLFTTKEEEGEDHVTDNFRLTKKEESLVKALRNRIKADVDQKTDVITITAKMQDPVVSAVLADTVVARLREYITDYRTNKARKDLEYATMLNEESKEEYYKAQQRLADYTDRNQKLATRSAQVTKERLENEATLAFNIYNETSLHLQKAKSRVQETTPVYTEITPATVPLKHTSPRKGLILAGFTFLAFAACCTWILFGAPFVEAYKEKTREMKAKAENEKATEKGKDENK